MENFVLLENSFLIKIKKKNSMSKKTNSLSLRIIKNKNWISRSFLEDFNYSKILYQDLYITNFIKNILQVFNI